jgi:hypothetical protein
MGTTLTGQAVNTTYDGLLKTTDNEPISATAKTVTDGVGTDSALKLGTNTVELNSGKTANLTAGTTNVATPTANSNAATKLYVDTQVAGVDVGVTSLNGLEDAISIVGTGGISVTDDGNNTITIDASM